MIAKPAIEQQSQPSVSRFVYEVIPFGGESGE